MFFLLPWNFDGVLLLEDCIFWFEWLNFILTSILDYFRFWFIWAWGHFLSIYRFYALLALASGLYCYFRLHSIDHSYTLLIFYVSRVLFIVTVFWLVFFNQPRMALSGWLFLQSKLLLIAIKTASILRWNVGKKTLLTFRAHPSFRRHTQSLDQLTIGL